MAAWEFDMCPQGQWQWHELGPDSATIRASYRRFLTLGECLEDAERHGFAGISRDDAATRATAAALARLLPDIPRKDSAC
jgi:hypothetical protein